jgi:hypothetical protein
MEKVYLVIGTIWEEGSLETFTHTIVNDYCVHSTMEGARAELYRILEETNKEAKQHEITFEAHMHEDNLEIIWTETGTEERWDIHCREVDKKI